MEASIDINSESRAAEVRRAIAELAQRHGMDESDEGRASLAGTELTTNLVKYGKRGSVTVSWFEDGEGASRSEGIQIVAVDHGPGIEDFERMARDGHSTGGSLGLGLGVLRRNADVFDVHSSEGRGAAFLIRVCRARRCPPPVAHRLEVGVREVPKSGQQQSGDAWTVLRHGKWHRFCIVDGLGHGPLAAFAAAEAIRVVQRSTPRDTPADLLNQAHRELKSTRGAVMGIVDIDTVNGRLVFAGVGNTTGIVVTDGQAQHLMPVEGIVGYNMRTPREHTYPFAPSSVLVLATDGLSSRMQFDAELLNRHPALIAGVLFRDHHRDNDDAALVVAKVMA